MSLLRRFLLVVGGLVTLGFLGLCLLAALVPSTPKEKAETESKARGMTREEFRNRYLGQTRDYVRRHLGRPARAQGDIVLEIWGYKDSSPVLDSQTGTPDNVDLYFRFDLVDRRQTVSEIHFDSEQREQREQQNRRTTAPGSPGQH